MDYVLLSPNDGELLRKAHQMLLDGGVMDDERWNNWFNPDTEDVIALQILMYGPRYMSYHNHACEDETTTPIRITPENLTESVATVINAYKKAQS